MPTRKSQSERERERAKVKREREREVKKTKEKRTQHQKSQRKENGGKDGQEDAYFSLLSSMIPTQIAEKTIWVSSNRSCFLEFSVFWKEESIGNREDYKKTH